MFAAEHFGVMPDLITCAKGLTNAVVPMGAVLAQARVYDAIMSSVAAGPELSHGYTYSGHPLACAAGLATLAIFRDEGLLQHAKEMIPYWDNAVHSLKGGAHIVDIRNMGMLAAIEFEAVPGETGRYAQAVQNHCFEHGVLARAVGDNVVLSPPLIIEREQVDRIVNAIAEALPGVK
jgi:beta-alanine--pyruvate transaminase